MSSATPRTQRRLSLAAAALLALPATAQVVEETHDWGDGLNDHLGWAVSLSGETCASSAPGRHDNSLGHVWIHERDGGAWTQSQQLTGSTATGDTWFGFSVSLDGDAVAAGDWADTAFGPGQPGFQRGAAYVFRRPDGASPFAQEVRLAPGDLASHDRFGWAVALSGDVLAVSAVGDDDGGDESGAVYLYRRVGGSWTHEARLTAPSAAAHERFGAALSLDGDTLAVGAPGSSADGADAGAVFVYLHDGSSWQLQDTLTAVAPARDERLGAALDLQGDQLAIGVPRRSVAGLPKAGAVEVWRRSGALWSRDDTLVDPSPTGFANLGAAVALDDDRVLAGAPLAGDAGAQSGRAVLFVRDGGAWSVHGALAATQVDAADTAGTGLDLDGPLAVLGAPRAWGGTDGLKLGLLTFFDGLPGATP